MHDCMVIHIYFDVGCMQIESDKVLTPIGDISASQQINQKNHLIRSEMKMGKMRKQNYSPSPPCMHGGFVLILHTCRKRPRHCAFNISPAG